VQIQRTIALLSDAQRAKRLFHINLDCHTIIEKHYNNFAASAELAYGQPCRDAPKNIRD